MYEKGWRDIYKAPVTVISIGNISMGGTGKTPMAEFVIDCLGEKGHAVAYLSRGYGRKTKGCLAVDPSQGDVDTYGDEALQVAKKFPRASVWVSEDRKEGIKKILEHSRVDVVLLDDAFQHRKVARDLDILMIDANRMPTHDLPIPAGRLREWKSGMKRANVTIVNKLSDPEPIPQIKHKLSTYQENIAFCTPKFSHIRSFWGNNAELIAFDQITCIVFSGIGNNAFFVKQVQDVGAQVIDKIFYRDHYTYQEKDIQKLVRLFDLHGQNHENLNLITTEKDFVRLSTQPWLSNYGHIPFRYVPITLKWWEGEELIQNMLQNSLEESSNRLL